MPHTSGTADAVSPAPGTAAGTATSEAEVDADFMALVAPLRRELTAHCYRMLGSVHEAEDLVQETYVRAWRAQQQFEGRSSLRTWMYTIATRVCLTALEKGSRRPLPTGLGQPATDARAELVQRPEITWLEPWPGAAEPADPDPAAVVVGQESIRLAFVAALQHLTPIQRAVLVLREVLGYSAAETAEVLQTTVAAVNSALQRSRARLASAQPSDGARQDDLDDRARQLVERYAEAFERYDIPALVQLLTEDATWEMPPFEGWYSGPEQIGTLIRTRCPARGPGDMRVRWTVANGQPAFGLYMRGADGVHRAFHLQVLSVRDGRIDHVAAFFDLSLFPRFGLPETL
ncbi:sigma-70 family RNA polymerase sigma factor [Auraticoccus sp. F435]|uniref:Sigma-70 family RNA polymerase sigma factor n=1 Tax=Auraticoccus cholistanensis TaxID=2656650 RepID=A0A6A9UTS7_9ACTN|nr:sigma-70 family RNA polymerase sigma factor [Auraticoccus cholistanensis]MVA75062.1 sigma-70 family RNA polymerase sigma factor [Auraticoccus cholistanensis]